MPTHQPHMNCVEMRMLQVPQLDRAQLSSSPCAPCLTAGLRSNRLMRSCRQRDRRPSTSPATRTLHAPRRLHDGSRLTSTRMPSSHSCGCAKIFSRNVCGTTRRRYLAIDAAERQVVNLVSERRNIRSLCRIDIDRQNIFADEIHVLASARMRTAYSRLCTRPVARR